MASIPEGRRCPECKQGDQLQICYESLGYYFCKRCSIKFDAVYHKVITRYPQPRKEDKGQ